MNNKRTYKRSADSACICIDGVDLTTFAELAAEEMQSERTIGTLSEKLLHKTLKFFLDGDKAHHEIPVLGSIVDVMADGRITEIQTKSVEKLRPKLEKLLPLYPVTVVLPLISTGYINYLSPESGEIISRRKSSRCDRINRAACELYKIADLLENSSLSVRVLFVEFEYYRIKTERGKGRRELNDRVPTRISSEIVLRERSDYRVFLPEGLGNEFTAKELQRLVRLDPRRTHNTLSLLLSLGIIELIGKRDRAYLYKKTGELPTLAK